MEKDPCKLRIWLVWSPAADAGRTHFSVLEHEKSVALSDDPSRNYGIRSSKYGEFLGLQEELYMDLAGNAMKCCNLPS
jgi:hypothetical protein